MFHVYLQAGYNEFEHDGKTLYWAAFLDGLQRVLLIIDDFTLAFRAQVVNISSILSIVFSTEDPLVEIQREKKRERERTTGLAFRPLGREKSFQTDVWVGL